MSPAPLADEIAAARAGERDARERLARAWLPIAYAVALAQLQNVADAEEVAQEAVIAALAKLDGVRDPARATAWLTSIARNRARNERRRARFRRLWSELDGRESAPATGAEQRLSARAELLAALGTLTDKEREIVLLIDL